jgi:hypothetical protein
MRLPTVHQALGLSGLGQAGDEMGVVSTGAALQEIDTHSGEIQKSQRTRAWDVLYLAPFLIYLAWKEKPLTTVDRLSLTAIAVATMYYNGRNYLANERLKTGEHT